jgi:hypothetical protein
LQTLVSFFVSRLSAASLKPQGRYSAAAYFTRFLRWAKALRTAKACGNWWKPLLSGRCWRKQLSFRSGAAAAATKNYSFNKRNLEIKWLSESLSLVVVMNVVELWKPSQLLDSSEFMMRV